jgi:hypothetical protein
LDSRGERCRLISSQCPKRQLVFERIAWTVSYSGSTFVVLERLAEQTAQESSSRSTSVPFCVRVARAEASRDRDTVERRHDEIAALEHLMRDPRVSPLVEVLQRVTAPDRERGEHTERDENESEAARSVGCSGVVVRRSRDG